MNKLVLLLTGMVLMMALTACNKAVESSAAVADTDAKTVAGTAPAVEVEATPTELASAVGSTIMLNSGSAVEVIAVGKVDSDPTSHSGLVAIEGRVLEVMAEKGAFTMTDIDKEVCESGCTSCGVGGCVVPVRMDMSLYEGSLPAKTDVVIVVATFTATDGGYSMDVQEVRSGETVLLTRKAAGEPKTEAVEEQGTSA